MERRWWVRFFVLLASVIWGAIYVYPTFSNLDPKSSSFPFKEKITLGLDLQGGLYLVMGVEFKTVFKDVLNRQAINLNRRLEEKGKRILTQKMITHEDNKDLPEDDSRLLITFDPAEKTFFHDTIKKDFYSLRITGEKDGEFELGLAHQYRADVREKTIDQSIEVIRNRIDELGVSEPTITSQGNDRVVVELPGAKDFERAKAIIGRTAKLEWKLVDSKGAAGLNLPELIATIEREQKISYSYEEGQRFSDYVDQINRHAKGKIPEGTQISFEKRAGETGGMIRIPYLLKSQAELTGDDLTDAQVQFDPDSQVPEVGFTLSPKGAKEFERVTGEHIREQLAIMLDNMVYSAPVIQSKIPGGQGRITLGWQNSEDLMKEAKDLAIVLRAGALPAQLEILEQRLVGPSLGQDSIRFGMKASAIGIAAVLVFMLLLYRVSGAIACVSLVLNVIFVLATLVGLGATLTLPGIAGIALTVGIGVDSNVVIYERIREELRAGKSIRGAIDAGFQKAFRTILDANVTNAAAAIILMNFGTGPIKGFAITLLIGIVTTLFTAVFVCRLIFDWYASVVDRSPKPALSI